MVPADSLEMTLCGKKGRNQVNNYKINAFGKTDVGLMRTINQDSIFVSTKPVGKLPNLFIVADGMGGHKAGDVASRVAIEKFVKYACTTHMTDPANILDAGIMSINKEIYDMANSNRDYSGMGTNFCCRCYCRRSCLYCQCWRQQIILYWKRHTTNNKGIIPWLRIWLEWDFGRKKRQELITRKCNYKAIGVD